MQVAQAGKDVWQALKIVAPLECHLLQAGQLAEAVWQADQRGKPIERRCRLLRWPKLQGS